LESAGCSVSRAAGAPEIPARPAQEKNRTVCGFFYFRFTGIGLESDFCAVSMANPTARRPPENRRA
jgi:hypothetical protein